MESVPAAFGSLLNELRRLWASEGIATRPATKEEVEAFEARYGVRLPADLRAYFTEVGGFAQDYEMDGQLLWFMALSAVQSLPESYGADGEPHDFGPGFPDAHRWFVIIDYLISSWVYAIRLSAGDEETPVAEIGNLEPHPVAASFAEFIRRYLADPDELLFGKTKVAEATPPTAGEED